MRAEEFHRASMSPTRAKPRVIVQTDLPHRNVRSNSLEVCDNIMAVAYQTGTHGATPAGIELFDISTPEAAAQHQLHRPLRAAVARRASALVHRRQDDPLLQRRGRFHAAQPEGRSVLHGVRRERSGEAARDWGAGGIPARRSATTRRRCRGIRSSTPAGARTTPMSIQSGRTAPMSAISTAAPACWTFPISASRSWWGIGIRIRRSPASPTP